MTYHKNTDLQSSDSLGRTVHLCHFCDLSQPPEATYLAFQMWLMYNKRKNTISHLNEMELFIFVAILWKH